MIDRFDGWIAEIGTSTGLRAVVGHWPRSPVGAFTDVLVERADGHRVLLDPSTEVLQAVPPRLATHPRWATAVDVVARTVLPGVGSTPRHPSLTRIVTLVQEA